jgi:hypothetical protein
MSRADTHFDVLFSNLSKVPLYLATLLTVTKNSVKLCYLLNCLGGILLLTSCRACTGKKQHGKLQQEKEIKKY